MANTTIIYQPRYTMFEAPINSKLHVPYKYMTIQQVAQEIASDKYHIKTAALRELKTEDAQRKFKQQHLDYVLFGGMFHTFSDSGLVMPSLHFCIDFDHIEDVKELEDRLLEDKYFETELMFRSPRGNGVKWLIDAKDTILEVGYSKAYEAIRTYLMETYSLTDKQVDKNCSNISRATYLCEDKNVYINPKYNNGK